MEFYLMLVSLVILITKILLMLYPSRTLAFLPSNIQAILHHQHALAELDLADGVVDPTLLHFLTPAPHLLLPKRSAKLSFLDDSHSLQEPRAHLPNQVPSRTDPDEASLRRTQDSVHHSNCARSAFLSSP